VNDQKREELTAGYEHQGGMSAARLQRSVEVCVKLTQIQGDHLICLSQREALMLFGVFQAGLLHEPMQACLMGRHEYSSFYHTMMAALAQAVAAPDLETTGLPD
jgi:hypothetical protein